MATVEGVRDLARVVADVVSLPEPSPTPAAGRAWEDAMLRAAQRLAAALDYDVALLEAAVGPPIEVGRNPEWRVLLSIAALTAGREQTSAARVRQTRPLVAAVL